MDLLLTVLVWVVLSAVVGWAGSQKGRSGAGFFFLSLFLSPLIGLLVVIAVPRVEAPTQAPKGHDFVLCHSCNRPRRLDASTCPHCGAGRPNPRAGQKKCPACAEWIMAEAKKCKHCGESQPLAEPAAERPALALRAGSMGYCPDCKKLRHSAVAKCVYCSSTNPVPAS